MYNSRDKKNIKQKRLKKTKASEYEKQKII